MSAPGPFGSPAHGAAGRFSNRQSVLIALGISAAAVLTTQVYSFFDRWLSGYGSYLGLFALGGAIVGLILIASWLERRPLRDFGFALREPLWVSLMFAGLLVLLYIAVSIDPGFLFGFGKSFPTPPVPFGLLLLSAPVLAIAEVGLFFGYLFRTLSRALPLRAAMLTSAGMYALNATDFRVLPVLGATAATQFLFGTTVLAFVAGVVLALYLYKSRWSLVGPVALAAGLSATSSLLPYAARFPSWETAFAATLVAYAVILVVVGLGLEEPRLQKLRYLGERIGPRRFRFRRRDRDRLAARSTFVSAAVVGVIAISFVYGLPVVLGTPTPVLAIATGSMVPTFHRGELVVIEHVAASSIVVGTIIAFDVHCLPSPTVHRVIRIVSAGPNWTFQTKGDANPVQDPCTVPYADVLGAVIVYVPYVGYLILDRLFAASVVFLAILVPMVGRGERR